MFRTSFELCAISVTVRGKSFVTFPARYNSGIASIARILGAKHSSPGAL